jgi:hypothetical protein
MLAHMLAEVYTASGPAGRQVSTHPPESAGQLEPSSGESVTRKRLLPEPAGVVAPFPRAVMWLAVQRQILAR